MPPPPPLGLSLTVGAKGLKKGWGGGTWGPEGAPAEPPSPAGSSLVPLSLLFFSFLLLHCSALPALLAQPLASLRCQRWARRTPVAALPLSLRPPSSVPAQCHLQ